MRNVIRIVAILFAMAVVFGCASSKTSTGKTELPTGAPDGTIHWEGEEFMAILEGQWGHGTLAYNGKVYKFKTSAVGVGGWGGQKLSAVGEVYNLKNISDFPGTYGELRSGVTAVKGIAYAYVSNDKGVTIHVKAHSEGLALTLGATGLKVRLVDEK
jgi:hypothetical protein